MAVGVGDLVGAPGGGRDRAAREEGALPWWLRVVLIYGGARLITTAMVLFLSTQLGPTARAGENPGFFTYSALWDGVWYWFVAANGYPTELPVNDTGHVAENQWAFMPVYPGLVQVLSVSTGLWWPAMAFFVSLVFGFGAALVLYRLLLLKLDSSTAMFSVVLFSVAPLSFILQMAYAESLHLFLLALALYLLLRRRYALLFPVVAVMALTRPSGLAFALALGLHWIARYRARARDPFPRTERLLAAGLTGFSVLMGFAWLLIAWAVTGSPSAYTDTELAWRAPVVGYGELLPFAPWFQSASYWLGWPAGPVLVVALVLVFGGILFLPAVRRLGSDLRFWLASYGLYLFAVFFPQSSVFRLLLPMFPLLGAIALPRSPVYRSGAVAVSLVLQWLWLYVTWGPNESYWTVP